MALPSSSRALLAMLALSLFAAAAAAATTTATSHPAPYTATGTASSDSSPHATTVTASSGPSPHAATGLSPNAGPATATVSSGLSPNVGSATASSGLSPHTTTATFSPHGYPPAGETMEEAEGGGGEREREEELHLAHDVQQLVLDAAADKATAARLQHLGSVLQVLGFREMAALVPSMAVSPVLAAWPGALTIFAVSDEAFEQESCGPDCWMGGKLVEHLALGSFPFADLTSRREMKIAAAMVGFCFTSSTSSAGTPSNVSIDGVKLTDPDLYADDRLVVHAVERPLLLPAQGSCRSDRILSRLDILRLLVRLLRR